MLTDSGVSTCATTVHGVAPGPGGVVDLPINPGPIVARSAATAAARRAAGRPGDAARAKLSSWTEVRAMLHVASHGRDATVPPASLRSRPWSPIWAVLLSARAGTATAATPASPELVIILASSGRPGLTEPAGPQPSWFAALTDRDPSLGGCPGGSTARLPFGVLTRDEEEYTVRNVGTAGVVAPTPGAVVSALVKLTTVRVLSHADPSLYGGCVQRDCSLRELLWPTIAIVRAKPGRTIGCLPGFASVPPGYHAKRVKQYVIVGAPGNFGIFCGATPRWIIHLPDLAPPAGG